MIFYVILRGLDTIEDDTELDNDIKIPLLRSFKSVLDKDDWTFDGVSEKEHDRIVLVEFDTVLTEFHKLKPEYQKIIANITHKMGNGMADYISKESQKNYEGVETIAAYDLYCHHVAGIVGEGLTQLAVLSGFGEPILDKNPQLYNSMGLFLQKTNIIRDFREDLDDGRSFWPKEVWSKYADSLVDFTKPENEKKALHCVSDLAVLSLQHVEDCIEYLENINEPSLFSFCAIPQVMSIATLELVFNNKDIFYRNIKIRRGLAAKLILESGNIAGVYRIFKDYTRKIHLRNRPDDPNFLRIEIICGKIEKFIDEHDPTSALNVAKASRATKRKNEPSEFAIFVAAAAILSVTCGTMVLIAYLNGARFDLVFADGLKMVNHLLFNGPMPSSAHENVVPAVTATVASVVESVIPHSDL
ncbi:bifunctional farnesyl-diphosphate farnesyltransferase/squalene synthase [Sugiyamaella lignohabitans]|uniref:Squalene synthase n=1 Tax=Sugiyamaella lignohabitans TaxID=796027 RepID=A0A167CE03_9ASCO|nr:bifunctional farnesyl-diphosphate farnesyltransferase/squalene synthase [Sugiyamaella lignohabitans]ANB11569.1 bifunctional farnesyl-diphosphate farnesyltransferase/squalene synthase [Sugiyamaella lignohabitans]